MIILITQALKKIQTINKKVDGLTIRIASIPDLIEMKEQAGRSQDIEDIKALEKLI